MVGTNPRRSPVRRTARLADRISSIVVQIFTEDLILLEIGRRQVAKSAARAHPYPVGTHFTATCALSSMPPTIPRLRRMAMPSCSETFVAFSAAATTRP